MATDNLKKLLDCLSSSKGSAKVEQFVDKLDRDSVIRPSYDGKLVFWLLFLGFFQPDYSGCTRRLGVPLCFRASWCYFGLTL